MTPRARRTWIVASSVAFVALILFASLLDTYRRAARSTPARPWTVRQTKPFDSAAWKAAKDESGDRWRMLPSLVAERPLLGRTRTEIEELLGPPSMVGWGGWGQPAYWLRWLTTQSILGDERRTPLVVFYENDVVVGYWSLAASAGRLPANVHEGEDLHQWSVAEEDQEW